ncbi:hypothetical protein AB4234_16170 [Vibrio cyclitrophicus]
MKRILIAFALVSTLSGCGVLMQMNSASTKFDFKPVEGQQLIEDKAVKSPVFKQVKSIAVVSLDDYLEGYPDENIKMYKTLNKQLETQLKSSGKYKVISGRDFREAMEDLDLELDLQLDTDEEKNSMYAQAARKLKVHGFVHIGFDNVDDNPMSFDNQLKGMASLVTDGSISVPMALSLEMGRARTGETLYLQSSQYNWVTGTQGMNNTKAKELNSISAKALQPLVNDMLNQ